jgi:mono/diheme cytochrome c family protein
MVPNRAYQRISGEEYMKARFLPFVVMTALAVCPAFGGAKEGKDVYDKSCKTCHAADGKGNPGIAKMMKVEMRALGSKEVQATSDADLKKIVTTGKGKMKPVAAVTGKQLDDVVAYVRTLK